MVARKLSHVIVFSEHKKIFSSRMRKGTQILAGMKRWDLKAGRFRGQLILSYRKQRAAPLGLGQWPVSPKNHWPLPADLWRPNTKVCDECVKCVQGSAGELEGTRENECLWCTYQRTKNNLPRECSHQCFSSLCVSRSKQSLITGHSGEPRGVCACTRRLPSEHKQQWHSCP